VNGVIAGSWQTRSQTGPGRFTPRQVFHAEIRLGASIRIGELSRELEKAEAHGGKIRLPADGKSKDETLAAAGISTTTAHRYEQLTGGREAHAQSVASDAASSQLRSKRQTFAELEHRRRLRDRLGSRGSSNRRQPQTP